VLATPDVEAIYEPFPVYLLVAPSVLLKQHTVTRQQKVLLLGGHRVARVTEQETPKDRISARNTKLWTKTVT